MSGLLADQTILAGAEGIMGNCWQAAIASLVGAPLDEVPHFVQLDYDGGPDYLEATQEWLAERGLRLHSSARPTDPSEIYLVCGRSHRGFFHCVLYRDGELYHDPHPDRTGIVKPSMTLRLVPLVAPVDQEEAKQ